MAIKEAFLASAGITAGALTLGKLLGDYDSIWQIGEYLRNGPVNHGLDYGVYFLSDLFYNFKGALSSVAHKGALAGSAATAATGVMAGLEHQFNKTNRRD